NAIAGEHYGVLERTAANEAHLPQRSDIPLKTEGPRARQQVPKRFRADSDFHFLLADQGMPEVHVATNAKFVSRINANTTVAFQDFKRPEHLQVAPLAAQAAGTTTIQQLHEGFGGAVQNGNFDRVDVDVNVVDSAGVDRSEEMLCSREPDALFHQTG